MSQKTNPISLRLQKTNKHFSSSWYTDHFYNQISLCDLQIRLYAKGVSEQISHLQIFSYVQHYYRRVYTYFFFLDTRGARADRERVLRLFSKSQGGQRRINSNSLERTKTKQSNLARNRTYGSDKRSIEQNCSIFRKIITQGCTNRHKPNPILGMRCQTDTYLPGSCQKDMLPKTFFRDALETPLSAHFLDSLTLYPIRVAKDLQFAQFLVHEVASFLKKGVSFKQVQDQIVGECIRNELVKGIRLSCSGRVGGRSKKAQKSKTQSVQWGKTSLHLFSSKLSFAQKDANTPFGKMGVKVWLCYK